MASSPSPACRQCNDLLRHLHAKNLEIAGLKEQLAQLAHFRQQRHASFTLRAKSKSVEPDATSLSEIITPSPTARDTIVERLQRERDDLAKTNDTLKSEVARLRDELAKNAATPRTAPSTCGGRQEVNASPASNYATRDDGASRPESHAPSAMQTPRAVSNRASLSGTPMSNRTSRSEGRSPRREATNPAVHQRATESRRELNQLSGEVLRSASRSPQLQRAAAQLCEEFEHSAVLRTEQRFARRVRQNPAVLAERIASLSPGRANVSQPQRAVASISGWRSLRLPIGERPPVVTSPRDLPPSPPRERGIGELPDTGNCPTPLFGERYLRVASGSSRLDEWDEAKVREAESALRTLRTAVMRVDRVAYMSMHQVEYSRDPCGPFKASFAAIKQIVATHARADKTDTATTVADGQTWPVTPAQLSMIPAAMAASLSKYLRTCLCSFDYMTETAHSAQQSILPTLREFFANIDTLSQIAAQPLVAAHL